MSSGETKIEWCDYTFNPWWGCTKVSPGCGNCYAETWDSRWGGDHWGPKSGRRFFGDKHWNDPKKWNRKAEQGGRRLRVFCASMCDIFEDHPELDLSRDRLWSLIEETQHLDWLLLTKRPENFDTYLPPQWVENDNPQPNVWLGVTAEDQRRANERIPILLGTPAPVHFISYEPALEEIDFGVWMYHCPDCDEQNGNGRGYLSLCDRTDCQDQRINHGISWIIAGAESGAGARPMHEDWARITRDECSEAGIPFFYKQKLDGGRKVSLPLLDGQQYAAFPAVGG